MLIKTLLVCVAAVAGFGIVISLFRPRRYRLLAASTALSIVAGSVFYLDFGVKTIDLPRHVITIFDCNTTSLETVEDELQNFSNISSISLVAFTSNENKQCTQFTGTRRPFSSVDYRSDADKIWPDRVGLATDGVCEDSEPTITNNIICAIELASDKRRVKHLFSVSTALLILENQSQLPQYIHNTDANDQNRQTSKPIDQQLVKKLLSLNIPLHIFNRSTENNSITTSKLKWVNGADYPSMLGRQALHLQLSDEAISEVENLPKLSTTASYRELENQPYCNKISEERESTYDQETFQFYNWPGSHDYNPVFSVALDYFRNISWRVGCDGWSQFDIKATLGIDSGLDFPSTSVYLEQPSSRPIIFLIGENESDLSRDSWWDMLTPPNTTTGLIVDVAKRNSFLSKNVHSQSLNDLINQLEENKCIHKISALRGDIETLDRSCLTQATAIVIIEPSTNDLEWIEQKYEFESRLQESGKVVTIVGPPVSSNSLPDWVNPAKPAPGHSYAKTTHQEMRIHVVPDRSLLAQAYPKAISEQREIIDSLLKSSAKYEKCDYPSSSSADDGIVDGKADLGFSVPRATFSYSYNDAFPVLARVDISGPNASDDHNTTSTAGSFDNDSVELGPYLDSNVLLQLTRFVEANGGKDAWAQTNRPNTIVIMFSSDVYHPEPPGVDMHSLKAFFESGARVIVVPLPENVDYVSKDQIKAFMQLNFPNGADGPYQALKAIGGSAVTKAGFDSTDIRSQLTYSTSLMKRGGFGRSFDSEADCGLDSDANYCGVMREGGARPGPERYTPLLPSDVLDSASTIVVGDGEPDIIFTEHEYGMSRIHTYGYSPFARDFIERDAFVGLTRSRTSLSTSSYWMSDSCFLKGVHIDENSGKSSPFVDGWGLQSLLDIIRVSSADISDIAVGGISAIESKDRNSMDITVRVDETQEWQAPRVTPENHIVASIGYDPINKHVTYRVRRTELMPNPTAATSAPIIIESQSVISPVAASLQPPTVSDTVYGLLRKVSEMSGGTGQLYHGTIPFTADKFGTATISTLILAGVLFLMSGFVRPWKGAKLSLITFFRSHKSTILKDVGAVGFSVQAVLTEWGANVGKPGTGRHAGVPLGVRNLISGDSMASVFWVDLIGIISPDRFPMKKPRVKLRSLNQSKESLIVLDDTGALNFPAMNAKIMKSEFASKLASALALAMRASGSVKLATTAARHISLDVEPDTDPYYLEKVLHQHIVESREAFQLDHKEITEDEEHRHILLIIDPLSASTSQIDKLSERVMSNGASFSLLLIVSENELEANLLLRDIQTGSLVDRSEWTPAETRLIRDKRLDQIRTCVEGHGGKVAIFDTNMMDSEVLSEIRESGITD